ncbi:MAG TPA: RNA polymerase sigma factor [Ktedonobacteraceae bacterium]|jgi:RNA polymerase sigma-70 factor (ECF subfamily)|nr:RNA polymerase sigma factor [Ktedonobacteraceae bacterium]
MAQSLPPDSTSTGLAETLESARAGDQKAFAQLFALYNGPICKYLAHLAGNDEVGCDLAQETFVRAWKGLPKLQGEIAFRPWLYRIATNVARSYLKRERLIRMLPWADHEKETSTGVLKVAGPEEQAGERECIAKILAMLSPQSRTCLLLQHVAGFSQREIAAVLGISEKSVSAYVSRGREQFRLEYRRLKGEPLR